MYKGPWIIYYLFGSEITRTVLSFSVLLALAFTILIVIFVIKPIKRHKERNSPEYISNSLERDGYIESLSGKNKI